VAHLLWKGIDPMFNRWFVSLPILLIMLIIAPLGVNAHAIMERSIPLQDIELKESPSEIRIQFTEEFDKKLSLIMLEDEKGHEITGQISSADNRWLIYKIPKLVNGIYKVSWQTLSVDTHPSDGSFRFSVAVPLVEDKPGETVNLDDAPVKLVPKTEKNQPSPTTNGAKGIERGLLPKSSDQLNDTVTKTPTSFTGKEAESNNTPKSNFIVEVGPEKPTPSATNRRTDVDMNDNATDEKHSHTITSTAEHDNDQHEMNNESDWRTAVYPILRLCEGFVTISIAGFLFFRYGLWSLSRVDVPAFFAIRNERWLYGGSIVLFTISGGLHVWMLADQLNGFGLFSIGERARTIIESTMLGSTSVLRPLLVAAMLSITYMSKRHEDWTVAIQAVAAITLISLFPLSGHAYGSASDVELAVISHVIHMTAAAIWFGGLIGLFVVTMKRERTFVPLNVLNTLIRRFSLVALPVILIVSLTGIVLTLLRVHTWFALFHSHYGQLILAKTAILLFVFVIAAFHRFVWMPRITKAEHSESEVGRGSLNKLIHGIRLEIVLAVAVFILAGMLSTTAPPEKTPVVEHIMEE
jgi:putative copper export protein/methionine-rich copper-binding protein CopC